jgi:hypothetical protein
MLTEPDEWGLKVSDIENAPTVIQASGKDTDVPTREEDE